MCSTLAVLASAHSASAIADRKRQTRRGRNPMWQCSEAVLKVDAMPHDKKKKTEHCCNNNNEVMEKYV